MQQPQMIGQPTPAFIGASWAVMIVGILVYLMGLWNAQMALNEKGYYFAVLCLGLYSAISLQKTLRDKAENIPTSNLYYLISWVALGISVALLVVGLFNATLTLSEKGFYMMAFTMSLFAAITVQKNTRDVNNAKTLLAGGKIGFQGNHSQPQLNQTPQTLGQINDTTQEKSSILQSPFRRNREG